MVGLLRRVGKKFEDNEIQELMGSLLDFVEEKHSLLFGGGMKGEINEIDYNRGEKLGNRP